MQPWKNTEETVGFLILATIIGMIWFKRLSLCSLIKDYQDEKPNEDKSPFDILIKDLMSALYRLNFWTGMFHFLSCFIPPNLLSTDVLQIAALVQYFLVENYAITVLITIYIKYIFVFQPDDVVDIQRKPLLIKARMWKWIILVLTTLLDIIFPQNEAQSQAMKILSRGTYKSSSIVNPGIGHHVLLIALFVFGIFFLKSILGLKEEEAQKEAKGLKKYIKIIIFLICCLPLVNIVTLRLDTNNVFAAHISSVFVTLTLFVVPLQYYIKQDEKLTLYAKVFLNYPPKVLPWQLPPNWKEMYPETYIDIAGEKSERS